jgi:hypothetical protein
MDYLKDHDVTQEQFASVWDTLEEDIRQVSHCCVITYYHNAIHRCTRTVQLLRRRKGPMARHGNKR